MVLGLNPFLAAVLALAFGVLVGYVIRQLLAGHRINQAETRAQAILAESISGMGRKESASGRQYKMLSNVSSDQMILGVDLRYMWAVLNGENASGVKGQEHNMCLMNKVEIQSQYKCRQNAHP